MDQNKINSLQFQNSRLISLLAIWLLVEVTIYLYMSFCETLIDAINATFTICS